MRFFPSVSMKHTKAVTHNHLSTTSKLFIGETTQQIIKNMMSSEYGTRLLEEKLMNKTDIQAIPLGILSWIVTEGGFNAIQQGKITLQDIKIKPAKDCLQTIRRYAGADNIYQQESAINSMPLILA